MTVTTVRTAPSGPAVSNPAAEPDTRYRTLTQGLFALGALLMPLGVVLVCIGWYGAAHTKYSYDQFPYLLSGGLLGVAVSQLGGFLYFGAWLAKGAQDQREASRHIADTMLVLADLVSRTQSAGAAGTGHSLVDSGAVPVLAGSEGETVHRRDCQLISHRGDLRVLSGSAHGLSICRVCGPAV